MIWSGRIWAQEIPKPDFTSLTRVERENIAICFQENAACHETLKHMTITPVQDDWAVLITAVVVGVIGGIVLDHQWIH